MMTVSHMKQYQLVDDTFFSAHGQTDKWGQVNDPSHLHPDQSQGYTDTSELYGGRIRLIEIRILWSPVVAVDVVNSEWTEN